MNGDLKAHLKYCAKCRADAQKIGFGLNYGMGSRKLANDLSCGEKDAKDKIRQYKDTYPAVEHFMAEATEEGKKYGFSFTVLGRRRSIPMIASTRKDEQAPGERLAVNNQIQGAAADVCKMAQLNLDAYQLESQYNCCPLLQVQDELVFECPDEHVEPAKRDISEIMSHPFWEDLRVPLYAEASSGPNWAE